MRARRWMGAAVLAVAMTMTAAPAFAGARADHEAMAAAAELVRKEAGARRLILLGEMHGTREAPQLTAVLAATYASEGPVLIGLEASATLQPALDEFMGSDGSADARARLLAAPFWRVPRERNDGRRNLETVRLVELARALKAKGRDVRVFAFDITPEEGAKGVDRDPEMARRVRAAFGQAPAGRLLVLSGNVHAMRQPPPFDGFPQPMGSFLADLDPFSVNISARGGEYWACQGSCGPQRQPDSRAESGPDRSGTFHLNIVLPRFTIARLIED